MTEPQRTFAVDRVAVGLVSVVIFGIVPGAFGWAGWRLVMGERWLGAAATLGIALFLIGGAVHEFAGAFGHQVSDEGLRVRGRLVRWAEVESAKEEEYGLVVLTTAKRTIRLRTYLFRDGRKLTKFILDRVATTEG